ncbi:MAG: hypothetical protein LC808_02230 [Actinobacteria bacterium]|nr:hypothetical protein [Actinomycetota bacterium]
MSGGFNADLETLDLAATSIAQTMRDMEVIDLEDISGDAPQYGHGGVHASLEHFCSRWQYGVEVLIEDGGSIVQAINAAVRTYIEADSSAERSLRTAGSGADPAVDVADG